jgi:hypothetical protein
LGQLSHWIFECDAFSAEVALPYAVCRKEDGTRAFIIEGRSNLCEYCGHYMNHMSKKAYFGARLKMELIQRKRSMGQAL